MGNSFKIELLVEHPEFVSPPAVALHRHWQYILKDEKTEERVAKLEPHLNRGSPALACVAFAGSKLLGTASLRIKDLEGYDKFAPWLAGVFAGDRNRGQGIGKALCRFVEDQAFQLGYKKLYLFTPNREKFYRIQGWTLKEKVHCHGHLGVLMEKEIK